MQRGRESLRPGEYPDRPRRPRVLIEHSDGMMTWALERVLNGAGYAVTQCYGPDAAHECPLVTVGRCAAAEEADVILHDLRTRDGAGVAVRDALRVRLPDTPVVSGCLEILSTRTALDTVARAVDARADSQGDTL